MVKNAYITEIVTNTNSSWYFGLTVNITGTKSSFGQEHAWRKYSNDTDDKFQDTDYIQWEYWQGVLKLPFHVPAMERRREKVPEFVRSADVIRLVRMKLTVATSQKGPPFIVSGEIAICYDACTKDGGKKRERWMNLDVLI